MKKYLIKEIFRTIQGEGFHAGTPATFVRFSSCNLWSGHDKDRVRDSVRHGSSCPVWCDTDFVGGRSMTTDEITSVMSDLPLVVFTGGEPLLHLDANLCDAIRKVVPFSLFAIETNGTVALAHDLLDGRVGWVCVSPKAPVENLKLRAGDELKVCYPGYNPLDYEVLAPDFRHLFVSPQANVLGVGDSEVDGGVMREAVAFCMAHPVWRLSIQQHKVVGLQ